MASENYHGKNVAVIHIGTMKVGTTSIQGFLRENKATLRDRDGLYWLTDYIRKPAALVKHMQATGAVGKSIVLCDEGLWHHAFSEKADIEGLKAALPGYEFRVIMYVRRPDEFLESWYLQGLKTGSGTPLFHEFMQSSFVRRGLNFKGRLPLIASIFGKPTIRAYERSQLTGGDAISDFLGFIGVSEEGLVRPPVQNVTPNPDVLMMARIMREVADDGDFAVIRQIAESVERSAKSSIIYKDELREIDRRYGPQIEWLHRTYGATGRTSFFDRWIDSSVSTGKTLRPIYDKAMAKIAGR